MYVKDFDGNYLLKSKIIANESKIILTYGGKNLTESRKKLIIQKAADFGLKKSEIVIEQGLTFDDIDKKNNEILKLLNELNRTSDELKEKQIQLDSIKKYLK